MKLLYKTFIILTGSLLLSSFIYRNKTTNYSTNTIINSINTKAELTFLGEYQFNKAYEETINYIKEHEGFSEGNVYTCPSSYNTIGYGHVILPSDTFNSGNISYEIADKLLRDDFDKAVKAVERETKLEGYKKLAIAHFIFAKGIGNFKKSVLRQLILENKPIDEELKKWCFYKNSRGVLVRSEYAYRIRLWEIEMYNRKF